MSGARRKDSERTTVAVIGYTNCGKTSLIKALTGDERMEPRDQLFATLDVTCHGARLPGSGLDTVFVDTVGFISDIPTPLIASFSATLEDALAADLLLHVADFSHPDHQHQISQVTETLRKLNVDTANTEKMVTVGNKIDLIPAEKWKSIISAGYMPVSAVQGLGLDHLVDKLEKQIILNTDRVRLKMRLRPGSQEWEWISQHGSFGTIHTDGDSNYNIVDVVITKPMLHKFKATFLHKRL